MQARCAVVLALVCGGLAGCDRGADRAAAARARTGMTDSELEHQLVGTWAETYDGPNGRATGRVTYTERWEFIFEANIHTPAEDRRVTGRGGWRIENGTIISHLDEISDPELMAPGTETREEIVRLTADELVYLDGATGRECTSRRVPVAGEQ